MENNNNIPGTLYARVRQMILHEWDPIGIQGYKDWPQDEYDAYVRDVCELVLRSASLEEIIEYLWWLETEHMGLPGQRQHTEQFAKRILELVNEIRNVGNRSNRGEE
jgi:hypothetical protein